MVGFLGLLAVLLGVVAEVKRVKIGDIGETDSGLCLYHTSPSEALGIVSALALFVAEVIVNAAAGYLSCCCRGLYRSSCKKAIAIICLVISWITFSLASIILMVGAVQSGQYTTSTGDSGTICCTYVKTGIFAVGAVLAIPSVICGIIYYILASEVKNSIKEGSTQNQNIAMAQPYSGKPYSGQP